MMKCVLVTIALTVLAAVPAYSQNKSQPASASVLSEHHLEVLDSMSPQAQAEFLLERAINRYRGASEQISARAEAWRGHIRLNDRLNSLFVTALNSDDLQVRAAAIDLNLAALDVMKTAATVDQPRALCPPWRARAACECALANWPPWQSRRSA